MVAELQGLPFYDPTLEGSSFDNPDEIPETHTFRVQRHPQNPNLRVVEIVGDTGQLVHAAECTPEQISELFSS